VPCYRRKCCQEETGGLTPTPLIRGRGVTPGVLAGTLLRPQCMDDQEAGGEAAIHASQSSEAGDWWSRPNNGVGVAIVSGIKATVRSQYAGLTDPTAFWLYDFTGSYSPSGRT